MRCSRTPPNTATSTPAKPYKASMSHRPLQRMSTQSFSSDEVTIVTSTPVRIVTTADLFCHWWISRMGNSRRSSGLAGIRGCHDFHGRRIKRGCGRCGGHGVTKLWKGRRMQDVDSKGMQHCCRAIADGVHHVIMEERLWA
jgi:hypothetical protein